jgi:hypothetical protein
MKNIIKILLEDWAGTASKRKRYGSPIGVDDPGSGHQTFAGSSKIKRPGLVKSRGGGIKSSRQLEQEAEKQAQDAKIIPPKIPKIPKIQSNLDDHLDYLSDELEEMGLGDKAEEILSRQPTKEVWSKYGSSPKAYYIATLSNLLAGHGGESGESGDDIEGLEGADEYSLADYGSEPEDLEYSDDYTDADEYSGSMKTSSGMRIERLVGELKDIGLRDIEIVALFWSLYKQGKVPDVDFGRVAGAGVGQTGGYNYPLSSFDVTSFDDKKQAGQALYNILGLKPGKNRNTQMQQLHGHYLQAKKKIQDIDPDIGADLLRGIMSEKKLRLKDNIIIERNGVIDIIPAGSLICEAGIGRGLRW